MCFGNDDPPPVPYIPPVPPPQEMLDVIDEVTGTQTITVLGANGKKQRLIQKLPRTQEEEEFFKMIGDITNSAIKNIKELSASDPGQLVDFAPFVETLNLLNEERSQDMAELTKFPDFNAYVSEFKDMQKLIIDEEYTRASTMLEERLAHTGRSQGTTAREERNLLTRHAAEARQKANVDAQLYGEQLKSADITNRTNAYHLREATRQGRLSVASGDYELKKDFAAQLERRRANLLGEQYGLLHTTTGIQKADTNKALSTMAPNMALGEFAATNNNALNYYNAGVDRLTKQHRMEMDAHNARGPGFGQSLLQLGGMGIGAYLGGPMGAMVGGSAGKVAGNALR